MARRVPGRFAIGKWPKPHRIARLRKCAVPKERVSGPFTFLGASRSIRSGVEGGTADVEHTWTVTSPVLAMLECKSSLATFRSCRESIGACRDRRAHSSIWELKLG